MTAFDTTDPDWSAGDECDLHEIAHCATCKPDAWVGYRIPRLPAHVQPRPTIPIRNAGPADTVTAAPEPPPRPAAAVVAVRLPPHNPRPAPASQPTTQPERPQPVPYSPDPNHPTARRYTYKPKTGRSQRCGECGEPVAGKPRLSLPGLDSHICVPCLDDLFTQTGAPNFPSEFLAWYAETRRPASDKERLAEAKRELAASKAEAEQIKAEAEQIKVAAAEQARQAAAIVAVLREKGIEVNLAPPAADET